MSSSSLQALKNLQNHKILLGALDLLLQVAELLARPHRTTKRRQGK